MGVVGHGLAGMSLWALGRRLPALRPLEHRGWLAGAAIVAWIVISVGLSPVLRPTVE